MKHEAAILMLEQILAGVITALVGWLAKSAWEAVRTLSRMETSLENITEKMKAHESEHIQISSRLDNVEFWAATKGYTKGYNKNEVATSGF